MPVIQPSKGFSYGRMLCDEGECSKSKQFHVTQLKDTVYDELERSGWEIRRSGDGSTQLGDKYYCPRCRRQIKTEDT